MKTDHVNSDTQVIATLVQEANSGVAEAARELGERYRLGRDVEVDDAHAQHWYSLAAELGDAPSQYAIGMRYLNGSGLSQDDRLGGDWIAKSAAQGYIDAIGELGTMFRLGRGIEADLLQAAQLHLAAAKQGDRKSQGQLADYADDLMELALSGNREAAFDLCCMYDWGLGVEQNPPLSWAWIKWALHGCQPMPDGMARLEDLDLEVASAHDLFKSVLDAKVRKQGEVAFRALHTARAGKSARNNPAYPIRDQTNRKETSIRRSQWTGSNG